MAAVVGLPLATPSATADSPVREIHGHGKQACPERSLCLYQDRDFNGRHDAPVWVLNGHDVDQLSKYDANDRASSVYYRAPFAWYAYLCEHASCGEGDFKLIHGAASYETLDGLNGDHGTMVNSSEKRVWLTDSISAVRFGSTNR
ncbi:peptidase inhibitor family I36 protein [Streptomyces sp. ICBB 8177]|uniref:peptidase inhibitor family I36 protein n=1 Tax=Streptomyces sp. ICBB 8177 TaxID=563922 RepID=UPI0013053D88|nr:peptidase inhibitor family I36 protein [Streptomyces sp. ICBB 8177]